MMKRIPHTSALHEAEASVRDGRGRTLRSMTLGIAALASLAAAVLTLGPAPAQAGESAPVGDHASSGILREIQHRKLETSAGFLLEQRGRDIVLIADGFMVATSEWSRWHITGTAPLP